MEFCSMTAKEFREYINGKFDPAKRVSESKYHAQKTQLDGITFDSKHEAKDWEELRKLEERGEIRDLRRQVKFELQPGFVAWDGKKVRPINYIADFVYTKGVQTWVQDSKGMKTKEYLLKKKMFMYKYPNVVFVES